MLKCVYIEFKVKRIGLSFQFRGNKGTWVSSYGSYHPGVITWVSTIRCHHLGIITRMSSRYHHPGIITQVSSGHHRLHIIIWVSTSDAQTATNTKLLIIFCYHWVYMIYYILYHVGCTDETVERKSWNNRLNETEKRIDWPTHLNGSVKETDEQIGWMIRLKESFERNVWKNYKTRVSNVPWSEGELRNGGTGGFIAVRENVVPFQTSRCCPTSGFSTAKHLQHVSKMLRERLCSICIASKSC